MLTIFMTLLSCSDSQSQIPNEARIKKDLWNDKTIAIIFTGDDKGRLLKHWENGYEYQEYTVGGIEVRIKTIIGGYDKPVTAIIFGDAVYNVQGDKYTYKKFRVASNEYEGIPGALSSKDVLAMIETHKENIFSSENQNIIQQEPEISIANDPNFKWGGIGKFTCQFTAKFWYKDYLPYDEKGDYIALVEMPFDFRVFRDGIGSPWRDPSSSAKRGKLKILEKKYMSLIEIQNLKTLFELHHQ